MDLLKKAASSYSEATKVILQIENTSECELFKQLVIEEALIYIRISNVQDISAK